jgi:hypothetical protein
MNLKIIYSTLILLGCISLGNSGLAEIYRWVDDKGNVHFGDKPGSADHEVITQDESDFSTIGVVPEPEKKETSTKEPKDNLTGSNEVEKEPKKDQVEKNVIETDSNIDEPLTEKEKAQLKRIKEMEALAEELRIKRLEREAKREKERKELIALREGCANAQDRINVLEAQLDRYIDMQKRLDTKVKSAEDVVFDSKHKLKVEELRKRKEFVADNCDNL